MEALPCNGRLRQVLHTLHNAACSPEMYFTGNITNHYSAISTIENSDFIGMATSKQHELGKEISGLWLKKKTSLNRPTLEGERS